MMWCWTVLHNPSVDATYNQMYSVLYSVFMALIVWQTENIQSYLALTNVIALIAFWFVQVVKLYPGSDFHWVGLSLADFAVCRVRKKSHIIEIKQ